MKYQRDILEREIITIVEIKCCPLIPLFLMPNPLSMKFLIIISLLKVRILPLLWEKFSKDIFFIRNMM